MSAIVTVAPREIRDLVYRCCRVAGSDPGSAELIAVNVVFAEVHLGGAMVAVAPYLQREELNSILLAHQSLASAEISARATGQASTASFDPAVPLGVLAGSMWEMAGRGALASGDFQPTNAAVPVDHVTIRPGDVTERAQSAIAQRWAAVYREGLVVDLGWFNQLETMASTFLVAESTLDDLD